MNSSNTTVTKKNGSGIINGSSQIKVGAILFFTILYIVTFKLTTEKYGLISGPLVAIPVVMIGFLFGGKTGFLASLISILLNALLFTLTVPNGWEVWMNTSWFGNLMVVLVGVIADYLHNMMQTREQTEAALRISEARYRVIVEDQTDLVCRLTADGHIIFANQSYLRFFKKTMEETIGSSVEDRDVSGQSAMIKASIASLGPENPVISFEEYLLQLDGTKRWIHWIDNAIIEEGGKVIEIQAVGRDITAHKLAENRLIQSERQLSEAQSLAKMGSWEWDILTNKTEWSRDLYTIFGITAEALMPNAYEGFLSCVHPLDRENVAQTMEQAIATKESFSVEYRIVRPDGIERYIHSRGQISTDRNGKAIQVLGSSQDISELKLVENEIRRRERYFFLLNQITHTILTARGSEAIYQTLVQDIANLFEADNCYITHHWDEEEQQATTVVSTVQLEHPYSGAKINSTEVILFTSIMSNGQALAIDDTMNSPHINADLVDQFSFQSVLGIPFIVGKHKLGATLIAFRTKHHFSSEEIALAEQVGQQIALALWTIQQEAEIQKRLRESDMLSKIAHALSETEHFGLRTVLQLIVTSAKELIPGAQQAVIHLLDEEQQTLSPGAVAGFANPTGSLPPTRAKIPVAEGVAGQVIASGETINIADVGKDERFISFSTPPKFRSLMVAPVKSGEKKLGTISIQSDLFGAFTEDESRLLDALGTQAAIAIENAHLLESTQQALKESNALYRINQGLVASLDPQELLKDVVTLLQKNFGYYHVQIYVVDPETGNFVMREGSGEIGQKLMEQGYKLHAGEGIVGYTAETGIPFFTNDVDKVHFFVRNELLPDTKSELAIPVKIRQHILGVLDVQQIPPARLTQRDLQLVNAVADQLAIALQKANLYSDLQTALQTEKTIRDKMVQSERLVTMGHLLASVSHELNNPLQAIQNALFLLRKEKGISSQGKLDLDIVLSEAERMSTLIERLRATYRPIQEEDFLPTQINDIIEDVHALISTHLRHNEIIYEFYPERELPAIPALPNQIRQVIINLLMNAVEIMTTGGKLIIYTKLLRDSNEVLLTVTDTGPGIPPDLLHRIFDPFVTNKQRGTGLGLTISYDIVMKHHGRITAENNPNNNGLGAIFKVWLPTQNTESK